jgi:predicted dehydrogenase
MKPKIALIGCGRIGFLLEADPLREKPCTHYGGALSCDIKITHACDANQDRLDKFAQVASLGRECRYKDHSELLQKIRPEMVIIATCAESHHEICIDAAIAGAKVIILEKPLALTLEQGRDIVEKCRSNSVVLFINHERRYHSRYITAKKIINEGQIGIVKTVYAVVLTGSPKSPKAKSEKNHEGPLLHDGTHLIDIIRFLFGDISLVNAKIEKNPTNDSEDRAAGWMITTSGIDIFFESGGGRKFFQFELEISGTDGKITIGNGYARLYRPKKSVFYTGYNDLMEEDFPKFNQINCFTGLYREAKQALSETIIPTSSGIDGYKTMEIIDAIYRSSISGEIVKIATY